MDQEILNRLAEPFDPQEIKWKPQTVSGNRALAIAYVDARVIQDRLDEVLGPGNWQDEYEQLADGAVICKLLVRWNGEWLKKMDVGGQSEQPDGGDRIKAAFSDALKRAAVKYGIGRYLYRLPSQWCDYDPKTRKFTKLPQLPPSALPKNAGKPALAPPPADKPAPQTQQQPPQNNQAPATAKSQSHGGAPPPIAQQQVVTINGLLTQLQKPYSWLAESIKQRYKTDEVHDLTMPQANELIAALRKMVDQKK